MLKENTLTRLYLALAKRINTLGYIVLLLIFRFKSLGVRMPAEVSGPSSIHLIYFTFAGHYDYLRLSIESLKKLESEILGDIFIYIDPHDPLSEEQKNKILEVWGKKIFFRYTQVKMSWSGLGPILNELSAYMTAYVELPHNSYLAKVDSDLLFVSDSIFQMRKNSQSDMLGKKFINKFKTLEYIQGGCYLFRVGSIRKMFVYAPLHAVRKIKKSAAYLIFSNAAEDATMTELMRLGGGKIEYCDDCLITDFLTDLNADPAKILTIKSGLSALHFEGPYKSFMAEATKLIYS